MLRKDRILQYIKNHTIESKEGDEKSWVSVKEIADELSIWPNDVSMELNKLVEQGILRREGKRNIKFFVNSTTASADPSINAVSSKNEIESSYSCCSNSSSFRSFIGAEGSMSSQIEMAKAAVVYPSYGLHTLIIGETGVGKSTLAAEMWKYACEIRVNTDTDKSIPFIRFNCAEYADNPQLLLSHLFGHAKGAFTGAVADRAGLVESANGGILLLDEIHRLPPTGQEMFFSFIDNGTFRRLGESTEKTINLMIIGTTTEDISMSLLSSFKRRFPVTIELANLESRPLKERLALTKHFFEIEATKLNTEIKITSNTLNAFCSYRTTANVGDLKNVIRIACAKSYLSELTTKTHNNEPIKQLNIDVYDLPDKVYKQWQEEYNANDSSSSLKTFTSDIKVIPNCSFESEENSSKYLEELDIYNFTESLVRAYGNEKFAVDKMSRLLSQKLENYFENYYNSFINNNVFKNELPQDIVSPDMLYLSNEVLRRASEALNRYYSPTCYLGLAIHFQQFLERARLGKILYNPILSDIEKKYAQEISFIESIKPWLSENIGTSIPLDEVGFITLFLRQTKEQELLPHIGLIVVMRGNSTAVSLAEYTNSLFSTRHVHWVNMKHKSMSKVLEELCWCIKTFDEGKGMLIVTDVKSLSGKEEELYRQTRVKCRIIQNADSNMLIEACRLTMSNANYNIDLIYRNLISYQVSRVLSFYSEPAISSDYSKNEGEVLRPVIIAYGDSIDSGIKIKELLDQVLPDSDEYDIVPASVLDDASILITKYGSRLRIIIGTLNPNFPQTPFIPLNKIFMVDGLSEFISVVKGESTPYTGELVTENTLDREELLEFFRKRISFYMPTIGNDHTMMLIRRMLRRIEYELLKTQLPANIIGLVTLHTMAMLERIVNGENTELTEENKKLIIANQKNFDLLKNILRDCFDGIIDCIPDVEVYYLLVSLPYDFYKK